MMRLRLIGAFVASVMASCVLGPVAGAAVPYGVAPQSRVLHLSFHKLKGSVSGACSTAIMTSGDYALVQFVGPTIDGTNSCTEELRNDRTGQQTLLRHRTYTNALAFGAPWILFFEVGAPGNGTVLYNIDTHRTAQLKRCGSACSESNKQPIAQPYRLGSQWLAITYQLNAPCGDGIHNWCGPISVTYYNVITHRVLVNPPTPADTAIDLDAPGLVVPLCPPLSDPTGASFTRYGPFAVISIRTGTRLFQSATVLQRCGSTRQREIGDPSALGGGVIGNAHLLLWPAITVAGRSPTWEQGIELPSLTRIAFAIPGTAFVDNEAVYAATATGKVSVARLPGT